MMIGAMVVEMGIIPAHAITGFEDFVDGLKFVQSQCTLNDTNALYYLTPDGLVIFRVQATVDPTQWVPVVTDVFHTEMPDAVVRALAMTAAAADEAGHSVRLIAAFNADGRTVYSVKEEEQTWEDYSSVHVGGDCLGNPMIAIAKSQWGVAWESTPVQGT